MKKRVWIVVMAVILALCVSACSKDDAGQAQGTGENTAGSSQDADSTSTKDTKDNSGSQKTSSGTAQTSKVQNGEGITSEVTYPQAGDIKSPVVNWFVTDSFKSGIVHLVMEIANPNDFEIDIQMDVTLLKRDNEGVLTENGTVREIYGTCLPAGGKTIVWANHQIMRSDEIKVEYTYLGKSNYKRVPCSYEETAKDANGAYLKIMPEGEFYGCDVTVVYRFQGEMSALATYMITEPEGETVRFETGNKFDDYQVYIDCYK